MKEKHIPELGCFVLPSHLVNFSNGAGCFLDFEVGGPKMFFFSEWNGSKMHDAESLSHTFSDRASIHMGV